MSNPFDTNHAMPHSGPSLLVWSGHSCPLIVIPNEVRDLGLAGAHAAADLDFGWRSASSAAINAHDQSRA